MAQGAPATGRMDTSGDLSHVDLVGHFGGIEFFHQSTISVAWFSWPSDLGRNHLQLTFSLEFKLENAFTATTKECQQDTHPARPPELVLLDLF